MGLSTRCINEMMIIGIVSQREQGPHRLVQFHKSRMGRQNYCFDTYRRYWVWEDPGKWRVYVHNVGGVAFEVAKGISASKALEYWEAYMLRLNLNGYLGISADDVQKMIEENDGR